MPLDVAEELRVAYGKGGNKIIINPTRMCKLTGIEINTLAPFVETKFVIRKLIEQLCILLGGESFPLKMEPSNNYFGASCRRRMFSA